MSTTDVATLVTKSVSSTASVETTEDADTPCLFSDCEPHSWCWRPHDDEDEDDDVIAWCTSTCSDAENSGVPAEVTSRLPPLTCALGQSCYQQHHSASAECLMTDEER